MASELNSLLDELSARLEKLKIDYERYFLGIEKLEPGQDRKEIAQIVRQLQTTPTANTALKFRLQSLNQRFLSYQSYWNRIVRQIEAGTYQRDLARVERDLKRKGVDANLTSKRSRGELEAALMEQLKLLDGSEEEGAAGAKGRASAQTGAPATSGGPPPLPAGSSGPPPLPAGSLGPPPVPVGSGGTPPLPAGSGGPPLVPIGSGGPPPLPVALRAPTGGPAAPPPPPPGSGEGAPERMKRLYRAYIAAKRKVGEPTDGVTYERLVSTLQKQIPLIQQKTGCSHVDFKIEIKDGKAILKAVTK